MNAKINLKHQKITKWDFLRPDFLNFRLDGLKERVKIIDFGLCRSYNDQSSIHNINVQHFQIKLTALECLNGEDQVEI